MKTKELKNKTVFDFSDYPAIIEVLKIVIAWNIIKKHVIQ